MNHGQAWSGRLEIRYPGTFERPDVRGAQIGTAEGHAGHPRRDAASGGEENFLSDVVVEELLFEGVDFGGVAFIKQDAEIAVGCQDEELVRIDHGAPEIAGAVEGDAVWPGSL